MSLKEQLGYTGNQANDILRFKNFNPINKGTIDASTRIVSIRAKDSLDVTKDIIDPDDEDEMEIGVEPDDLVINPNFSIIGGGRKVTTHPYGYDGAPLAIGDSISEGVGIPDDIDPWVDLLFAFVKNQIYNFVSTVNGTDEFDTEAELSGEIFKSKSMVYNVGKNEFDPYIKKYIPSDNKLKFKDVRINLGLSTVPNNLFTFDSWHASFSDSDAIMKNKIYSKVGFMFEILLPESILDLQDADDIDDFLYSEEIYTKVLEFLSHEITHGYEYYNRKLNGMDTWKDRLMSTNKYIVENQLLSNISDDWKEFLNLIYLSLDFEINARISQVYYNLVEQSPNTKYDFMDKLKSTSVWSEMESLKNFDPFLFYENFSYKSSDEDLKDVFRTLKIYSDDEMEGVDMKHLLLIELIKLWDKNMDKTNKLYSSGEMRRLGPFYINNPLIFFKKFAKRFHRKSEIWEKKMYRLSSKFQLD